MEKCNDCGMNLWATDKGVCPKCTTNYSCKEQPLPVVVDECLAVPPVSAEDLRLDVVVKSHILRVLDICNGNKSHAAKALGVSVKTIYNKLEQYGHHF